MLQNTGNARINLADKVRTMTALAIDTGTVTQIVTNALQRRFGNSKSGAKMLVRAVNCNERAAQNWLAGRNAPDAMYLLRLIAAVPELAAEVRRLTGMREDMDPEFEADFQKLMQTYAARRQ